MADNTTITAGAGTTIATDDVGGAHYQKMKLFDGTADSANAAVVNSNGSLQVQGYQPANTSYTGVVSVSNLSSFATNGLNVVTLTLRTFTGTTPSITYKLQASDDGGTNWIDLQGINNTTGQVGVSWTQASALSAGTAGYSCDYAIGGYTHVRIAVTAISGASATAAFGLGAQSMPYEPSPGVILNAYDGSLNQLVNTNVKGTQGARGLATQDLKDAGRTNIMFSATAVAAGTTGTETAVTLVKSAGTGATSSAASFVITSGKTFRITSITFASRGHSTATAQVTTFNLRLNTAGAVTTTSTPILLSVRSATPATASAWDRFQVPLPDGIEIAGNGTIQFGVTANAVYTTNAPTWDVFITGFEY